MATTELVHNSMHALRPLTKRQMNQLTADLNQARVAVLDKGRTKLSYLKSWDVKRTLIRVFGFGGFSADADECEIINIEDNIPKTKWNNATRKSEPVPIEYTPDGKQKYGTANFRVTAKVRVRLYIHQLGAVYTEYAACSQTGPDIGEVTDFAIKTAESDALKRAAIYLGTQFGLSLYDDGSTADVVQKVMAPDQIWPPADETSEQKVEREAEVLENGVTPEQRAENQKLVNRAMNMRAARDAQAEQDASEAVAEGVNQ